MHDALRHSFATKLLKVDPRFDIVRQRKFKLDALKSKQTLLADPSLGIRAVRVRKLRMAPPRYGAGFLTVEAPPVSPTPESTIWAINGSRREPGCMKNSQ